MKGETRASSVVGNIRAFRVSYHHAVVKVRFSQLLVGNYKSTWWPPSEFLFLGIFVAPKTYSTVGAFWKILVPHLLGNVCHTYVFWDWNPNQTRVFLFCHKINFTERSELSTRQIDFLQVPDDTVYSHQAGINISRTLNYRFSLSEYVSQNKPFCSSENRSVYTLIPYFCDVSIIALNVAFWSYDSIAFE